MSINLTRAIGFFSGYNILIFPGMQQFAVKQGALKSIITLNGDEMTVCGGIPSSGESLCDPHLEQILTLMNQCSTGQINLSPKGYRFGMITREMETIFIVSGKKIRQSRVERSMHEVVAKFLNHGNSRLVILDGLKTESFNGVMAMIVGHQSERFQVDTGSRQIAVPQQNCHPIEVWMDGCMTE